MSKTSVSPKSNLVQFFSYKDRAVRVQLVDGEMVWVIKDVCQCLGLGNPSAVAARLERGDLISIKVSDAQGHIQTMNACTEGGLYDIILGARGNERTRPFQRWVTHEVLPAIMRQGYYSVAEIQDVLTRLDKLEAELAELKDKRLKRLKGMHLKMPEGLELVAEWLRARTRALEGDERLTPSRILYDDFLKWANSPSVKRRVTFTHFCKSLGVLDVPAQLAYDERGYRRRSRPVRLDG